MQLLVPAASAALIVVVALSATGAASTAETETGKARATASARVSAPPPAPAPAPWRTGVEAPGGNPKWVAPRAGFVWPLSPRPEVSRRFELPRDRWSTGHRGVDLQAAEGQPVLSAGEGVVAFSGVIAGRGVVTVRHGGGLRTTYEPVDQRPPSGAVVHRSTPIGVVSPTPGHCTPLTCLHWGALTGQAYRDPLSLLGFGRPILLPLG